MHSTSRAISKIILVLVALAIIVVATFAGFYLAGLVHLGSSVKLIGECRATDYALPDIEQISVTTIGTVTNGTTSYYFSTQTITATTVTLNSTTYATTLIAESSTSYVTTNTRNLNAFNSYEWEVSVCTFAP